MVSLYQTINFGKDVYCRILLRENESVLFMFTVIYIDIFVDLKEDHMMEHKTINILCQ